MKWSDGVQIIKALDRRFGIASGAEISMEADPGTFDAERLREYMALGLSRFSIGVQAFQEVRPPVPRPASHA
jgi:coproporphyrinogen III oxidase-like Fe-S oxidoreductase